MNAIDDNAAADRLSARTARLWQPLVCLSLLATIGASWLALERCVHSEALGKWVDRYWCAINEVPVGYSRQFLDTEDRMVLEDIEDLDGSQGGVFFFGASNMKWSMRVPDLPPDQRRLVHNFGSGEGAPYFHQQFTEFLVNHKNILAPGAGKVLIVYGASLLNAKPADDSPSTVFSNMWRRYGLYSYDFRSGIEPVPMSSWFREYEVEKARCSSFVQGMNDKLGRLAVPKALRRRTTTKDTSAYVATYQRRMGPNWEQGIADHCKELQAWLNYVRQKKMEFAVVLLPLASWHQRMPYTAKYDAAIRAFCVSNHVPLFDYSNLAADDEFFDHIHMNERGMDKTDPALMKIAHDFLARVGVWPGDARVESGIGATGKPANNDH